MLRCRSGSLIPYSADSGHPAKKYGGYSARILVRFAGSNSICGTNEILGGSRDTSPRLFSFEKLSVQRNVNGEN